MPTKDYEFRTIDYRDEWSGEMVYSPFGEYTFKVRPRPIRVPVLSREDTPELLELARKQVGLS